MKIIIEGAGEVGSHLAKMLSHEANDIVVIDTDPARIAKLSATYGAVEQRRQPERSPGRQHHQRHAGEEDRHEARDGARQ